jgi:polyhydroxybutyrate depolymerase
MSRVLRSGNSLAWVAAMLLVVISIAPGLSEAKKGAESPVSSLQKQWVSVNGKRRVYFVYAPFQLRLKTPLPVILVLHGAYAKGRDIMRYTQMNAFAEEKGFIAVYPERNTWWDWDLKHGNESRDVPYIHALLDDLKRHYSVDARRVYATGYSSGGELAEILACTIPGDFAAFAPVESNMRHLYAQTCQTRSPVSILMINGTRDRLDPWEGGGQREPDLMSIPDSIQFWKQHNHCTGPDQNTELPPHASPENTDTQALKADSTQGTLIEATQCQEDAAVSLLKIEGGGHTWAGSTVRPSIPPPPLASWILGPTSRNVSNNEQLWNFFQQHSRPNPNPSDSP